MENKAIIIIAHGSMDEEWVSKVDDIVSQIQTKTPIFLAFIENVKDKLIEDVVQQLNSLTIDRLLVIPLFVSSASNHVEEIRGFFSKDKATREIEIAPGIDDHEYVVEHIIKQCKSEDQNHKNLLLIAHGSNKEKQYRQWETILKSIIDMVQQRTNFLKVSYATILPNTIEEALRIDALNTYTMVVPLFLSRGYYTEKKIPKIIKEYKTNYINHPYIEGNWIDKWLEKQIQDFSD